MHEELLLRVLRAGLDRRVRTAGVWQGILWPARLGSRGERTSTALTTRPGRPSHGLAMAMPRPRKQRRGRTTTEARRAALKHLEELRIQGLLSAEPVYAYRPARRLLGSLWDRPLTRPRLERGAKWFGYHLGASHINGHSGSDPKTIVPLGLPVRPVGAALPRHPRRLGLVPSGSRRPSGRRL